jgi:predicted dehydrogenase
MVLQALRAGKHVFVEKPLTLDEADLNAIADFYAANHGPVLMVGYNRRFAPVLVHAREALAMRATPLLVNYRMNAGFIPGEHWAQTEEGGGRNMGEACHIYDVFNSLTASGYCSVSAQAIRHSGQWRSNDNFVATISYADGSVCTLTYSAMGHSSYPKECMEIFADGKVISMVDYKSLTVQGGKRTSWNSKIVQKGQPEELEALAHCLREGGEWPIPLQQLLDASRISLLVEEQLGARSKGDGAA